MTIDAGPGDDTITTGDGADVINGGDGVDTLNGGAGGDRILGNPGNDMINGGAGDDTLVWNNGDGNDHMNGDDGLDRIENNLGAADDVSQVSVLNGKVHYARVNAPFRLDVATSEVFELNTFGGNDTLDAAPGLGALIAITADAGSGDDRFNGNDEADTFFGGLGNDTLDPGAGADAVDGQDGNDTLTDPRRRGRPRPRRCRHRLGDGRRGRRGAPASRTSTAASQARALVVGKTAQAPAQERRVQRQGRAHLRRLRARGLQGHPDPVDLRQGQDRRRERPGPPRRRQVHPQGRREAQHHRQAALQHPASGEERQGQGPDRLPQRGWATRRPARGTSR